MRPLKVALFVKSSPVAAERENRNMGMWSYPVPEFEWKHYFANNFQAVDKARYKDYDLIFHEDAGYAAYMGSGPPVVYFTFDSFLDEAHRAVRIKQAHYADLTLVDHDDMEPFRGLKALRFPYCTNDHLYKPLPKNVDVAYHCQSGARSNSPRAAERSALRTQLSEICEKHRWSYVSGALSNIDYAASMGHAKIVVNLVRGWLNRPHREFDAMACEAAFLTDPYKEIAEDFTIANLHYPVYKDVGWIELALERLLAGEWIRYAEAGRKLVMDNHTWAIRAQQLRDLVAKEFGI